MLDSFIPFIGACLALNMAYTVWKDLRNAFINHLTKRNIQKRTEKSTHLVIRNTATNDDTPYLVDLIKEKTDDLRNSLAKKLNRCSKIGMIFSLMVVILYLIFLWFQGYCSHLSQDCVLFSLIIKPISDYPFALWVSIIHIPIIFLYALIINHSDIKKHKNELNKVVEISNHQKNIYQNKIVDANQLRANIFKKLRHKK